MALYGADFFDCICQIYYSILAIMWGVSIEHRVIDKHIRTLFLGTIGMILLVFTLQLCRYKLLGDDINAIRHAWYAHYISILFIPCFLHQMALRIGIGNEEIPRKSQGILLFIISSFLAITVLTNDFHQTVFKFPEGIEKGYDVYNYGIGFYLIYVWVVFIYILSLMIILKKCRVMAVKKLVWIPMSVALVGGLGEFLIIAGALKYQGINIWQTGELFFFWVAGFEEACITIGLIPANVGYRTLLDYTNKPFIIADSEGEVVYKSANADESMKDNENMLMFTNEIRGGTVSWAVDLSVVYNLNRQIEEATEQIEMRNDYLHTQNDLKAEQSKLDARNELYDNVAKIVNPQIVKIKKLLNVEKDTEFDENLKEIAVLNAYIKRRSNMELLRGDEDMLSLAELSTALNESCEYLKLCGVETLVAPTSHEKLSASQIVLSYDFFENIIENSLDSLKSVFVTVACTKKELTLRLLINADAFEFDGSWRKDEIDRLDGKVTISKEFDDTSIVLFLRKEGAR